MRNLILLLIICTLNGCGLFKKTTKHKEETLSKRELQVSDNSKESLTANQQVTISDKSLTINKSGTKSTIKGEKIIIDNKGNIECQNCEVEQENQNENQHQKDSVSFSNSNIEYAKEADRSAKESFKDEKKISNVVSEPKGSSFIWFAVAGLIFVVGIIWYLRRK